jgi:hypothetical protein
MVHAEEHGPNQQIAGAELKLSMVGTGGGCMPLMPEGLSRAYIRARGYRGVDQGLGASLEGYL